MIRDDCFCSRLQIPSYSLQAPLGADIGDAMGVITRQERNKEGREEKGKSEKKEEKF